MSKNTKVEYFCEKCGKKLPTYSNHINICTPLTKEWDNPWSRLHITIEHHHGFHNDGKTEQADLCQKCVIFLLADALKRVRSGERVSKGVDSSDMLKFNQPF